MTKQADTFQLTIRAEITRVYGTGGYTGERLSIDETVVLGAASFLEATRILSRFHELSEHIKTQRG